MAYSTIRDVAHVAGVSVSAVSQVLNNTGRISQTTRQKVLDSIRQLNYIPNSAARSMRSSSTKTIGMLVPDIRNSYFANLISVVTDELSKNGYVCLIGSSGESVVGQDSFLRSLLSQRIDGAIIVPQGTASAGLELFLEADLPVVFLDRRVNSIRGADDIPLIDSDPFPGMRSAIGTAYALGHRMIGFVHGPIDKSPNLKERQDAFSSIGCEILGGRKAVVAVQDDPIAAVEELRQAGVDTVVFGYSPDAVEAIRYYRETGLVIGEAVSIISFDDIPLFELATPAISVISQRTLTMAAKGVQALFGLLSRNDEGVAGQEDNLRIPTTFISRSSVVDLKA